MRVAAALSLLLPSFVDSSSGRSVVFGVVCRIYNFLFVVQFSFGVDPRYFDAAVSMPVRTM
jgi:hypothetical protein